MQTDSCWGEGTTSVLACAQDCLKCNHRCYEGEQANFMHAHPGTLVVSLYERKHSILHPVAFPRCKLVTISRNFIALQVLLYKALGFTPPTFGHMSLILASDKSKLSKR